MRFEFAFQSSTQPFLFFLGVTPRTAWVEVTDERVEAHFGPWTCATERSNVTSAQLTGPYNVFKVIGPHLSLSDRGLTLGTTPAGGVCMLFREPVRGIDPVGLVRHPGLTVTVADREGLMAVLG